MFECLAQDTYVASERGDSWREHHTLLLQIAL